MMKLYYFPLSGYSQKTLTALYEKGAKFEPVLVNLFNPTEKAEYAKVNRLGKVPFLHVSEGDWKVPESSIIIEYIDRHCPGGTKLIPDDPDLARQVRFRDRLFDLYVNEPTGKIFFDGMRPEGSKDPYGVKLAHERLESTLTLVDEIMAKNTWAMGDAFTMADCAAAPALNQVKMMGMLGKYRHVEAYANRLCERPSYARVLKEAEPFMAQFMASQKR
jgi:glutathione S-transferase